MRNRMKECPGWVEDIAERILAKMSVVAKRNLHKIPFRAMDDGFYDDMGAENICYWTNGFWGGIMWQLYHATGDGIYREIATDVEMRMDEVLLTDAGMDHDSGFKWMLTAVAHLRMLEEEGKTTEALRGEWKAESDASRNRALLAACNLAGRFNLAGRYIRAWNDTAVRNRAGWAIIDCMMNLSLLYWAAEETGDPRFYQIATAHADTAQKYFIRTDYSACHIVEFDPTTGAYVKSHGGQGYAEGSSWTRGQAWAIYGFALSYRHTGNGSYLKTAKGVADYFMANLRGDGIVPVDFCQPEDCALEDSSAAVIAACGMLEIAELTLDTDKVAAEQYQEMALRLVKVLTEKRCNFSADCDYLLEKCTGAFHDDRHEFPLMYADYYLIEAVWKLMGWELFLW